MIHIEHDSQNTVLVTGGAGFIGANFVLDWLAATRRAGRQPRRAHLRRQPREPGVARRRRAPRLRPGRHRRPRAARPAARRAPAARRRPLRRREPRRPQHPRPGRRSCRPTSTARSRLLEAARALLDRAADGRAKAAFRFLHVSTDEVYGSLAPDDAGLHRDQHRTSRTARTRRARRRATTWCAPGTTPTACRCSRPTARNNYGPYHFPEKLIPLMIVNALAGKPLPVYGDGHAGARLALRRRTTAARSARCWTRGRVGETYNIGGWNEKPNLEIVQHRLRAARRAAARSRRPATRA